MLSSLLEQVSPPNKRCCDSSSPVGGTTWSRETSSGSGSSGQGSEDSDLFQVATKSAVEMRRVHEITAAGTGLESLKAAFDIGDMQTWQPTRFKLVGKIQDAVRNYGQVVLMIDTLTGNQVAVKQIPNSWICQQPEEFDRQHPGEKEQPWVGIGCAALLTSASHQYHYACPLLGVFRDAQTTYIVMELAREGDLFSWCSSPQVSAPGPERETLVQPLVLQIFDSVRELHDMSIVHGDISLENILLSGPLQIQLIDFGKSSSNRFFGSALRCKPSYEAPEMHTGEEFDGFLSDVFAIGVTIYALLCNEYPWLSTRPGCCKSFDFFYKNGFHAFIKKRRVRSGSPIEQILSAPVIELLAGLLDPDPTKRLTLGEAAWAESGRRSVGQSLA
mmetsp:Transcript_31517/g.104462  ORF Transcript_31517/g.104462 Transcript_31517/m.104462 type:complete len:388 (+) Transcript_31517:74-1237(+)